MDEKQCLECGNHFFGRADKKFCADSCRNAFNNKVYATDEAVIKKVNRVMRKNWMILNFLNPDDKLKIPITKLAKQGFDFDYITSNYFTKEGKEYRFCYEQGYLMLSDNNVLLVKRSIED
ncbi:MAG: hypothetical protein ACJA08_002662 [Cyclobacteriaceae bacterium]|jgi:hypothetical protein